MTLYNGYPFPPRTTEQVIRYNAYCYGQDPDDESYITCACGNDLNETEQEAGVCGECR